MTTARLIYEDRCPKCRALADVVVFFHRTWGWSWWFVFLPALACLSLLAPLPPGDAAALLAVGLLASLFAWTALAPRYDHLQIKPWVRAGPLLRPFADPWHPGGPDPSRWVCLSCSDAPVFGYGGASGAAHLDHPALPHNFYLLVGDMLYGGRSALARLLWYLL